MRFEDVARLVASQAPRAGDTRVVAIDGPAGSGKTHFAERLAAALKAPVIHMDDLIPGWDGLAAGMPRLLEWVLLPLAGGQPVRYRRYDWNEGRYGDWVDLPQTETLIVEGVTSASRTAAPYLGLVVWIEAPPDVRLSRGLERDGHAARQLWERWRAEEDAFFAKDGTSERAHLRVIGEAALPHDPDREFVAE